MKVGDSAFVSGYVTKDKFIRGRTLEEMDRSSGFERDVLNRASMY